MCGIVAILRQGGHVSGEALQPSRRRTRASRPRRAEGLGRPARPRRARPRAPQHHRPRDRRSADRQRGRARLDRRERRVLRLRARSARARARRATASARAPTARSRCTSTRTAARSACTACAASSRSRSGTSATASCSPRATASASSRCTTPSHDGAFYLASEVKALRRSACRLRWDRERSSDFSLRPRSTRRPHAVRGHLSGAARSLPDRPTATHVRIMQYWDSNYPRADEPLGRADPTASTSSGFRAAFDEAVRLRLRADVPVACYLSGGIDSCAVLGFASRHRRDPIRAFTLSLRPRRLRRGRARREHGGDCPAPSSVPIPHRAGEQLADQLRRRALSRRAPFVNAHFVAKYLLSRAVRDAGIKVVLTGEGCDEMFAGYPHFRARHAAATTTTGKIPDEVEQLARGARGRRNKVSRGILLCRRRRDACRALMSRLLGFVPCMLPTFGAQFRAHARDSTGPSSSAVSKAAIAASAVLDGIDVEQQLTGRAPVHQSLYLWGKTIAARTTS